MICDKDCFNCKYPDCIVDVISNDDTNYTRDYNRQYRLKNKKYSREYFRKYREDNKERLKANHKKYYEAHKEEISAKRKAQRLEAHSTCTFCGKEWSGTAIMYKRKAFCDSDCLYGWLNAQGLIKVVERGC